MGHKVDVVLLKELRRHNPGGIPDHLIHPSAYGRTANDTLARIVMMRRTTRKG